MSTDRFQIVIRYYVHEQHDTGDYKNTSKVTSKYVETRAEAMEFCGITRENQTLRYDNGNYSKWYFKKVQMVLDTVTGKLVGKV